jgi:hypothetical protein
MRQAREIGREGLFHLPFGEPFLTAALSFSLFRFFSDTRLLIKAPAFQLPKQAFPGQFLFGDLQRLFHIVIEDFDFHRATLFLPMQCDPVENGESSIAS